jgi:hypothetical protein
VTSLKLGHPTSVEACSSIYVAEAMNWDKKLNLDSYPRACIVRYKFPARGEMPPLKLTWYDGGLMPERPEELEENRTMGDKFGGALYIGEKGKILTGSHGARGLRIIPEKKMKEYKKPPKTLPRSIGHAKEWIAACKGGKAAGSNFDYAGPLSEIVLLGNVALRFNKVLKWDGTNMQFPNAPEANEFIHRTYREGWSI